MIRYPISLDELRAPVLKGNHKGCPYKIQDRPVGATLVVALFAAAVAERCQAYLDSQSS